MSYDSELKQAINISLQYWKKEEEIQQIKPKLSMFSEYLIEYDIKGDGNCFFRCISLHMYNDDEYYNKVRQNMISWVESNKNDYKRSPYLDTYINIDSWINVMKKNGSFGDGLAIEAICMMLECEIVIHVVSSNNSYIEQFGIWFNKNPSIKLVLRNNHYTLLQKHIK